MAQSDPAHLTDVLGAIPRGRFVLTAAHDHTHAAMIVEWVQRCSQQPPQIMLALPKGNHIEPLIRNSRCFALCQIAADDCFLARKLTFDCEQMNPLVSLRTRLAHTGAPIIERAMSYLDCEVVRHLEFDADHRLYIGKVVAAEMLNPASPFVRTTANGYPADRTSTRDRAND